MGCWFKSFQGLRNLLVWGRGAWSFGIGGLTRWSETGSLLVVRWWVLCWDIELDEHDCLSVAVFV